MHSRNFLKHFHPLPRFELRIASANGGHETPVLHRFIIALRGPATSGSPFSKRDLFQRRRDLLCSQRASRSRISRPLASLLNVTEVSPVHVWLSLLGACEVGGSASRALRLMKTRPRRAYLGSCSLAHRGKVLAFFRRSLSRSIGSLVLDGSRYSRDFKPGCAGTACEK